MAKKEGASHKGQVARLARIGGQLRGVISMIEDQRYCMEIITQLKSMQSALKAVEREIIRVHIDTCVKTAIDSGSVKEAQQQMKEIASLLDVTWR